MAEIEHEVKTYTIRYLCDECGKGWMKPTGMTLTSYPLQYPHVCSECGRNDTFWDKYPKTILRPIIGE